MTRRIVGQTGLNALSDNGTTVTSTEAINVPGGSQSVCGVQVGATASGIANFGGATYLVQNGFGNVLITTTRAIALNLYLDITNQDVNITRSAANTMLLTASSGVNISNKVGSYNGQTLAGNGVVGIVAITSQKSETGADAAVLSYTPAAAAGTYRISISWSVQTATSAVIGWTATWKDSGGVAQAPTNLSMFQSGTAAPALTFTAGTGSAYYAAANFDIDNSATAIVIKTTMGTGTLTASKLTATIERII